MRILYDYQIYSKQDYGGISRYFYELSKGLLKNGDEAINPIKFSDNVYTLDKEVYTVKQFLTRHGFKGKRSVQNIFNKRETLNAIKADQFDVFHPTYYNDYFSKTLKDAKPLVITVYDLIHEKLSNEFPILKKEALSSKKYLIERADIIIAISKSTKQDLIDIYGINPNKIKVTYLGNSLVPSISINFQHSNKKDYILFVGNRSFYKNFIFFISSIASILTSEKLLTVVCAGGGPFNKKELRVFQSLGIENKIKHAFITDKILATLYQNALFFVFPSLYEGFGIPVLEAFACSCPVILSNRSSLPEIAGDAAIYIDPESKEDILDKVKLLLYNEALTNEMKDKGKLQLNKFSWQKTVQETIEVYKSFT